ncbi:MAG: alpha/beta hydrolase [Spirochaetaceae bacterium]|jgi:acetyl esterase/lipase|nr:alpha/beta hydrolase [Spirochaetaceae bacterium]
MNAMVEKYKGAPWLNYVAAPPEPKSLRMLDAVMKKEEAYPLYPGNELLCFDYTVPEDIAFDDHFMKGTPEGGGLHLYLYKPKAYTGKKWFFYIHGGGFMRGNGPWCKHNALALAKELGINVAACEYHYTPAFKYPVALNDVEEAYRYIRDKMGIEPNNIIMGGESAGGTYTMAMAQRLRSQGRPLPSALVNMSAYLDLTLEGESYTANYGVDPTFTVDMKPTVPFYLADMDLVRNPEVSPIFADVKDYPPTFFACDETEIFLSCALTSCDKLQKAGVPCEGYITHGFVHVFMFEAPEIPESKKFYAELKKFLETHKVI